MCDYSSLNHTLSHLLKIDPHLYILVGAESAENCTHINTDQVFLPVWLTQWLLPSRDGCYRASRELSCSEMVTHRLRKQGSG